MSKISLSTEELELVTDTKSIMLKHSVIQKVYDLFGELYKKMKVVWAENNKHGFSGKISKGENYLHLPYVMLDYPSIFGKDGVFAIRTMFWWGNFFSITFQISGTYLEKFNISDPQAFQLLRSGGFSICVNKDEWQHHFEADNYVPASAFDQPPSITGKQFFKVAKMIPVALWDQAEEFLLESFSQLIAYMHASYPGDKTDPLPGFPKGDSGL